MQGSDELDAVLAELVSRPASPWKQRKLFKRALRIDEQLDGVATVEVVEARYRLGGVLLLRGRIDDATRVLEGTLASATGGLGDHLMTIRAAASLSQAYLATGRVGQAERTSAQAVDVARRVVGEKDPVFAEVLQIHAVAVGTSGKIREAVPILEKVLELRTAMTEPGHPSTVEPLLGLAEALGGLDHRTEALALADEAFAISRSVNGAAHEQTLRAQLSTAILLHDLRRRDQAEAMLEKAGMLARSDAGPGPGSDLARTITTLEGLWERAKQGGGHIPPKNDVPRPNPIRSAPASGSRRPATPAPPKPTAVPPAPPSPKPTAAPKPGPAPQPPAPPGQPVQPPRSPVGNDAGAYGDRCRAIDARLAKIGTGNPDHEVRELQPLIADARAAGVPGDEVLLTLEAAAVEKLNQHNLWEEVTVLAGGFVADARHAADKMKWLVLALHEHGSAACKWADHHSAVASLEEAVAIADAAGPTAHDIAMQMRSTLTAALWGVGRYDEALAMLDDVIVWRERLSGPTNPLTKAVKGTKDRWTSPDDVSRGFDRSTPFTYRNVAAMLDQVDAGADPATARKLLRTAFDENERLIDVRDRSTIATKQRLGQALHHQGWYDEARMVLADATHCAMGTFGATDPRSVSVLADLNRAKRDLVSPGSAASGAGMTRSASEIEAMVVEAESILPGGSDRAKALLQDAVRAIDAGRSAGPGLELRATASLGFVQIQTGAFAPAITALTRARTLAEQQVGPTGFETIEICRNLALAYLATDRVAKAIEAAEAVVTGRTDRQGPSHPDTLMAKANHAVMLSKLGRYVEATAIEEEVLQAREAALGPTSPETIASRNNLAESYIRLGDPRAVAVARQALADATEVHGPNHERTVGYRSNVAAALQRAGEIDEAVALMSAVVEHRRAELGPEHELTVAARLALSRWTGGAADGG